MNILIFIFIVIADIIIIIIIIMITIIIETLGNNDINNLLCKSIPNLH